jgi:Sec-independent protein translocase protein TatA
MYNISFLQILVLILIVFLLFGDFEKMSFNLEKLKSIFKIKK